jgi:hypothetical protein
VTPRDEYRATLRKLPLAAVWAESRRVAALEEMNWRTHTRQNRCKCGRCRNGLMRFGADTPSTSPSFIQAQVDEVMSGYVDDMQAMMKAGADMLLSPLDALATSAAEREQAVADHMLNRLQQTQQALVALSVNAANQGFKALADNIEVMSLSMANGVANLGAGLGAAAGAVGQGAGDAAEDLVWGLLPVVVVLGGGLLVFGLSGGVQAGVAAAGSQAGTIARVFGPRVL